MDGVGAIRGYVFWFPSWLFLMPVIWGRLRGYHLAVLSWPDDGRPIDRFFRRLGLRKVDLGNLPEDLQVISPWVALGIPLQRSVDEACRAALPEGFTPEERRFFRGELQRQFSKRILNLIVAVQWAEANGCRAIVCFTDSKLDSRLIPFVAAKDSRALTFGTASLTLARRVLRQPIRLARSALAQPVHECRNWVQRPQRTGEMDAAHPAQPPKVMVVVNNDLTYGDIYDYTYLLSRDRASSRHPEQVAYLADAAKELSNGQSAAGLPTILSRRGFIFGAFIAFKSIPLKQWSLAASPTLLRSVAFMARTIGFEWGLEARYPTVTIAILTYDIQIPLPLLHAIKRRGIRTISSHERPQIGLVPYLPITTDTLLVESKRAAQLLEESHFADVEHLKCVGLWRTDLLHKFQNGLTETDRPLVLVLPLLPVAPTSGGLQTSELSLAGFRHFLNDILSLAIQHRAVDFIIRSKSNQWLQYHQLTDLVRAIGSLENISIGGNNQQKFEPYHLAAKAHVVIGKYTSLLDEALAVGIPIIVHDYTHNRHPGACVSSQHIPSTFFAHSIQEMDEKLAGYLAHSRERNFSDLESIRNEHFGALADGNVIRRINQVLDDVEDE